MPNDKRPLVRFVDIPMRYNSFLDEIEVKLENADVYINSDPGKLFYPIRVKHCLKS